MKNEKLKLTNLKLSSFILKISDTNQQTVKGGTGVPNTVGEACLSAFAPVCGHCLTNGTEICV